MNSNNFIDKFKKVIWVLTPFILIAAIVLLVLKSCESEIECIDCDEMQEKIDTIEQKIRDKDCLDCNWDESIEENDTTIAG